MNTVDELGIAKNTIFIFCADNGTHGSVKSVWGDNRTKIKGGKMTMTDRGSRVPLLVSWPGKTKPGSQCNDLVELADFLPTVLDLASAPEPKQSIDGTSFLPQLLGKEGSAKEWVHIEHIKNRQIRNKEWTYTNKGDLIKVSQLGEPENRPERTKDHIQTRKEMNQILNEITLE